MIYRNPMLLFGRINSFFGLGLLPPAALEVVLLRQAGVGDVNKLSVTKNI